MTLQLVTEHQVCEYLGVSRAGVYRLGQALPSVKIGRCRRWPIAGVDAYIRGLAVDQGVALPIAADGEQMADVRPLRGLSGRGGDAA